MRNLVFTVIVIGLMACTKENNTYVSAPPENNLTVTKYLDIIASCDMSGGFFTSSGFDTNKNGLLEEEETNEIKITCDVITPIEPEHECDDQDDDWENEDYLCKFHKHGYHCKRKKV